MFTTRPELKGTFGAVASTHWLASAAGMAVLEAGGNAFDAAVAAGFTLQVVEPHLNGPGGEVPMILRNARRNGSGNGIEVISATIERFRGFGLDLVPGSGLLAAVVPGSFDAWLLLLRDHGTMRPREVLRFAVDYAGGGYPLVPRISETIASVAALFRDEWPSSAAVYLPGGEVPRAGSLFRNPTLARSYQRLLEAGEAAGADRDQQIEAMRDAWYRGFVAEAIERFCAGSALIDSSGERHGGLLTADDLARWRATREAPLAYDYHGFTVMKGGVWSQGPVFLQQLALLAGFDLSGMDPLGPEFVHCVTECAKLAFADRESYYGDPRFVTVPIETLLSPAYNEARRALVAGSASQELRPGALAGFRSDLGHALAARGLGPEAFDALGGGEPTVQTGGRVDADAMAPGDTCHVDVIDRDGNMISATPSGGWLQSSPVIPELGFCLSTRGQMFWLEEGTPASLAPGKRPRTTLSVNLALRDGEPYMVWGTPGGDYQDQWSLSFLLRHLHHGMSLQEAIDHPTFQTDHMPSSFWPRHADLGSLSVEGRFPAATVEELKRRGHRVSVTDDWSLGRLSAVARDGDTIKAAANPRFMQGYAICR